MSFFSRIANALRGDRLSRELQEEMQSHIDEAVRHGRDPQEARRAFGAPTRFVEESRDLKIVAWLDALRADAVFGWRRIAKYKVTSLAAILSLGLAMGACTSAFRLIDAVLLRPLPVIHPERLYVLEIAHTLRGAKSIVGEGCEYPMFQMMRASVKDQAELVAISYASPVDLSYGSDQDAEKAMVQYVSGGMFPAFGMTPALGRLFTDADEVKPGGHPYAVLAYDYWKSRFGKDPRVLGRTFRMGTGSFEIVGVAPPDFTGTEPGSLTQVFVPTMMHAGVKLANSSWVRTYAVLKPGVRPEAVVTALHAPFIAFREDRLKSMTGLPPERIEMWLGATLRLIPAASGYSEMLKTYRITLVAIGVLVALVLMVACANVANLLTAQGAGRTKEMALRISIGAGRRRLIQLLLAEGAWLALFSSALGVIFAWWSAPLVVRMISPPGDPIRLVLHADWRMMSFTAALAIVVACLFSLAPALRASGVEPVAALKGGDPHSRRRTLTTLLAAQVAFCIVVLFVSGLFIETFRRLSRQPLGFSDERIIELNTRSRPGQSPVLWSQVADRLRSVPGVESVALSSFALLTNEQSATVVAVGGGAPSPDVVLWLPISPGWIDTMHATLLDGRDFRPGDLDPGPVIVNEAFAKRFFNGENPVGKTFESPQQWGSSPRVRYTVVGWMADVRYRDVRQPVEPTFFIPFARTDPSGALRSPTRATFTVRTSAPDPLALDSMLSAEIARAQPAFRVFSSRTQQEIDRAQTLRERVLAALAAFFSGVALLLSGVGLYGVLDYSVTQRRREIGIRMAIGARAGRIARLVTREIAMAVAAGAAIGLVVGINVSQWIATLLFGVKPADARMLAMPAAALLIAACVAALPAVLRAARIDPIEMLRSEL